MKLTGTLVWAENSTVPLKRGRVENFPSSTDPGDTSKLHNTVSSIGAQKIRWEKMCRSQLSLSKHSTQKAHRATNNSENLQ